jgi:hypothetical protein
LAATSALPVPPRGTHDREDAKDARHARAGADLVILTELLGHSTSQVTMRYAHTNREAKARAVALLA